MKNTILTDRSIGFDPRVVKPQHSFFNSRMPGKATRALLFLLLLVALTIPTYAGGATSGTFGDGGAFSWSYQNGTLTLSGSGETPYISSGEQCPWAEYRDAIQTVVVGEGITALGAKTFDHHEALVKAVLPKTLTKIGSQAFYSCTSLSDVNFPSGLSRIELQAFYGTAIESLSLPNSITFLGVNAFGRSGLKEVTFPAGLDSVRQELFFGCEQLARVTLPEGVAAIESEAFSGCTALTEITLPESLRAIGGAAFSGCTGLREIRIPGGVSIVGGGAFHGCTALSRVELSEGLTTVDQHAFSETALVEVALPDTVVKVEPWAFQKCAKLERLALGGKTAYFDPSVVNGCSKLRSIDVPASNLSLYSDGGILYQGDELIRVPEGYAADPVRVLPGTKTLGYQSFSGCAMRQVELPDGLTTLHWPFASCKSLESLSLPDSVTTVKEALVSGCDTLRSVSLPGGLEWLPADKWSFSGVQEVELRATREQLVRMRMGHKKLLDVYRKSSSAPANCCILQLVTTDGFGETASYRLFFSGEACGSLPVPERSGYRFMGWFDARSGGRQITESTVLEQTADLSLYAQWSSAWKVVVGAAGGTLIGENVLWATQENGYRLRELPAAPTRPSWRFAGWYTAWRGGERVTTDHVFKSDALLFARWERPIRETSGGGELSAMLLPCSYNASDSRMTLGQSRSTCDSIARDHLFFHADGTFCIVKCGETKLRITNYSADGERLSEKTLATELPIFGGFFAGETYYYVVSGQNNPNHSDAVEVIRITWYDKSWRRVDSVAVRACTTAVPFDHATVSMAELNGRLSVLTACKMYNGHQSDLWIYLDVATKSFLNEVNALRIDSFSHCLYQRTYADDTSVYLLRQGDGNPRSLSLTRYQQLDGGNTGVVTMPLMTIPGPSGMNETGVAAGGFVTTGYGEVSVANTVDHSLITNYSTTWNSSLERDVYIFAAPWDARYSVDLARDRLTNYQGSGLSAGKPRLVKLEDGRLCVLWEEFNLSNGSSNGVRYAVLDASGTPLTANVLLADAALSSSCQPVCQNGRVVWYVDKPSGRVLYSLAVPDEKTAYENGMIRAFCTAERATMIFAWYDASGRQLGVVSGSAGYGINMLPCSVGKSASYGAVFFVDENMAPLCPKQTVKLR